MCESDPLRTRDLSLDKPSGFPRPLGPQLTPTSDSEVHSSGTVRARRMACKPPGKRRSWTQHRCPYRLPFQASDRTSSWG